MDSDESDERLVSSAVGGDRAAFAALVSRHYDTIFRVAWKWCGNRDDAEDVAQDVCIRLGKAIRSFGGQAKFSTWLYRVTLNAVRDFQRRRQSELRNRQDWANDPGHIDVQLPECDGEDSETAEMWAAVRQLPPKQRDAVMLICREGLSHLNALQPVRSGFSRHPKGDACCAGR